MRYESIFYHFANSYATVPKTSIKKSIFSSSWFVVLNSHMHLGLFLNCLFCSISLAVHALTLYCLIIEALKFVLMSGKVFPIPTNTHACTHTQTHTHTHACALLYSPCCCLMMSSLSIQEHDTSLHLFKSTFVSSFLPGKSTGLSIPTFTLLPKRQANWGAISVPQKLWLEKYGLCTSGPGPPSSCPPFPSSVVLDTFNFCASPSVLVCKTGSVVLWQDGRED